MKYFFWPIIYCISFSILAYDYENPKLLIQSSITQGYNLPSSTLFTDSTPSINDNRQIAVTLGLIDGQEIGGIWSGDVKSGKISYFRRDLKLISNVLLNKTGEFSFTVKTEGEDIGFFQAKKTSGGYYSFTDLLKLESFWDFAHFGTNRLVSGTQYFVATNFRNNKAIYSYDGTQITELEQENNRRSKSKISFLFNPQIHESGKMTYKVRLGDKNQWSEDRPDQIILNDSGVKTIIASDIDFIPTSKWKSFRNSASVNSNGMVAFIGKNINNQDQLVISDGLTEKIIATEGIDLKSITYFTPIINNSNWVAFRGETLDGKHAVFVANEVQLKVVVKQFQNFQTPIGEKEFAYGKHIPFGGNIGFNNRGDIVLNTGLSTNNTSSDKGKGIVVLLAK